MTLMLAVSESITVKKGDSMVRKLVIGSCGILLGITLLSSAALSQNSNACRDLPGHALLKAALTTARNAANGGFNLDMWGTVVNRDGEVCAVAFTGVDRGSQWPGSRVISAQKANTANAFSLSKNATGIPSLALATANLFFAVQPGKSLFGLQESNPVDTSVAYGGSAANYGQHNDPMVGGKIGGVNVFGGGLALYKSNGPGNAPILVGAIGVSGDTSCADHHIAWRTRHELSLDYVTVGVAAAFAGDAAHPDNIIYDIVQDANGHDVSPSGFGHSRCFNTANQLLLPPARTP